MHAMNAIPELLGLIAGKGVYPQLVAAGAKKRGVRKVVAVAFRGETDRAIEKHADEVKWVYLGQLGVVLDELQAAGVKKAIMAGQITPTHLFRLRFDRKALEILRRLKLRNAETIFGAVAAELKACGIDLLPASTFMEDHMPQAGTLSRRSPTEAEKQDIDLGLKAARITSNLDIGQTVIVKEGTILAVEAFEGTNAAIRRAAALGGSGIVIVKVAKQGHDMRFDIPVVGLETMRLLKKVKAAVLAVEAGRAILLEMDRVISEADRIGLCLVAIPCDRLQSPV